MAAVTVTVAMRTVGLLLVSALMVVPVATAQQLTRGVPDHAGRARWCLGMVASVAGRRRVGLPSTCAPGATIVLLALAGFAAGLPGRGAGCAGGSGCAAPFAEPADAFGLAAGHTAVPEDHAHEHGAGLRPRRPCRTATTSTTSTTATGTPPTESHYDEH